MLKHYNRSICDVVANSRYLPIKSQFFVQSRISKIAKRYRYSGVLGCKGINQFIRKPITINKISTDSVTESLHDQFQLKLETGRKIWEKQIHPLLTKINIDNISCTGNVTLAKNIDPSLITSDVKFYLKQCLPNYSLIEEYKPNITSQLIKFSTSLLQIALFTAPAYLVLIANLNLEPILSYVPAFSLICIYSVPALIVLNFKNPGDLYYRINYVTLSKSS